MKKIIFIIILCMLFACSPQKRLNRIIKNNPYLLETETIYMHDTVTTEAVNIDTIFNIKFDTINIVKDKLKIQLIKSFDTIILKGECLPDTIIRQIPISVPVIKYIKPTFKENISKFIIIGFAIAFFFVVGYLIGYITHKY